MFLNKNILITGGLGFIFSYVTEYLSMNNKVTVIDNISDGSHPELLKKWNNVNFIEDDINNIQKYAINCDIIIHAAAESNVDKSIENTTPFFHSNVAGTMAMLEFARQLPSLKKFIYINTDEVYGSTGHWCSPKDILNPSNPYSASKAAASMFCWAYNKTYSIPMKEIRMCNIIGARQANTKLLPRTIERIQAGMKMPIYDGGKNTREYMDVRDVPTLIERAVEESPNTIVNLTTNQELSILEVIKTVENVLGKKAILAPASRPGHDQRYRMQPDKILYNEVGQKIKSKTIKETVAWMVSDPQLS